MVGLLVMHFHFMLESRDLSLLNMRDRIIHPYRWLCDFRIRIRESASSRVGVLLGLGGLRKTNRPSACSFTRETS